MVMPYLWRAVKVKVAQPLSVQRLLCRSGCGRLTVSSNPETIRALLSQLPEAMSMESDAEQIEGIDKPENYDAIAFGPGVGFHEDTQHTLKNSPVLQW